MEVRKITKQEKRKHTNMEYRIELNSSVRYFTTGSVTKLRNLINMVLNNPSPTNSKNMDKEYIKMKLWADVYVACQSKPEGSQDWLYICRGIRKKV